ncbi:Tetratricopeptide repeat-containing protein [Sinosporangium album]|uniref:Tetratricopeptide repeat-containing protein n=1 Tax=Sinosporangium album TaxID=504805 RepID=A0A1G7YVU9_9ACTN|nr:tetratricopeptide repeat protein [Sinosporangium album]SDH00601.1 Tetratricopeptide repeat-containing protein [Sinosporangium album]
MVTAPDPVRRAWTLLEMRRPAEAERELRGVLAQDPHHVTAHSYLGLALVQQGNAAEAVAMANEAVRLAPDLWFAHYMAGDIHYRADRPDAAIAAAKASLALQPDYAPTWSVLARAHLAKSEWAEVAEAARRGLAIEPENSVLVSLLALALTKLGEAEEAKAAAAHAVRLNPESATAHLAYGRAALAFGDPRGAADAFREVLRLDPGFDQARDLLVAALKQRNPVYRGLGRLTGRFRGGRLVFLLPAIPPLIVVFILVALLHWAAWVTEAWTTLRLARAKATRLLFENVEARVSALCCGLVVAGAAVLGLGVALGLEAVGTAGVAVMALVTPVQEAAHTGSARGRKALYGWAGLLTVTIAAATALGSASAALLSVYAGLATIWIAGGVRRVLGRGGQAA